MKEGGKEGRLSLELLARLLGLLRLLSAVAHGFTPPLQMPICALVKLRCPYYTQKQIVVKRLKR